MGEVYRARDTRLGRDVAIKVLPPEVTTDPDRRARFDREARALASLNHPHIAAIHGVEEADDVRALVLEFVDGETLAARAQGGRLPVDEALSIAKQVADALEAAHEKGIVHRDLKPGNVMVTRDGMVKVLDFGLAKLAGAHEEDDGRDETATMTAATRPGLLLGTPAYMSPEQVRGKSIDKRTDIWAFGCVLFEMLARRRAFPGDTSSDAVAAILEREPPWDALPASLPAVVVRLLRRCLERDPKHRLHDIADARIELEEVMRTPERGGASPILLRGRDWVPWLVAALTLVAVTVLGFRGWLTSDRSSRPSTIASTSRFTETLSSTMQMAPAPALAVSPDGRQIVYVALQAGVRRLYSRALDESAARSLVGTEGADQPFFSPDGRWIGFFADGSLKKVSVAGGTPITLCDAASPRGGTWAPDNTIIFAPAPTSVLLRVSASGGMPQPVTELNREVNEASHRWPSVSAGGDVLVFGGGPTVTSRSWNESHLVAQSLKTGERRVVVPHGTYPQFAGDHLLYVQDRIVYAQAFDPGRLDVSGEAAPVLEQVETGGLNGGAYQFALSATGTLLYAQGAPHAALSFVWVDRQGTEEPLPVPPGEYSTPRLSPDGRQVASTVTSSTGSDVWVYDLSRSTGTRVTTGDRSLWPLWSPDGSRVLYASSRTGSTNVYSRSAGGGGAEEQLTVTAYTIFPQSISSDGKVLVTVTTPTTRAALSILELNGTRSTTTFHAPPAAAVLDAAVSPDGHWVAYVSNESGRNEVYARPFPGAGAPTQVSTAGGSEPAWARSGRELFFRNGPDVMAVEIAGRADTLSVGPPKKLFSGNYISSGVRVGYDVSAAGRFLFVKLSASPVDPRRLQIVVNWFDELDARMSRSGR
jgi:serine/threonine-protein kinase